MFSLLYYSGILSRGYGLVNRFLQENFNFFFELSNHFRALLQGRPEGELPQSGKRVHPGVLAVRTESSTNSPQSYVNTVTLLPDERCSPLHFMRKHAK